MKIKRIKNFLTIVALFSFIFSSYIFLKDNFVKTFLPNRFEYQLLNNLSTEVDINYFKSILGEEILKNKYDEEYTEYIFFNKKYFVQAIVNISETVNAYSITTLSRGFRPTFVGITLGKSSFIDLHEKYKFNLEYGVIISITGAHDYFYTEGFYQANPGGYQTFYFSNSAAGYFDSSKGHYVTPQIMPEKDEGYSVDILLSDGLSEEELRIFNNYFYTNSNVINTFTVTSPGKSFSDFNLRNMYAWGPDYNQVRVLNTLKSFR